MRETKAGLRVVLLTKAEADMAHEALDAAEAFLLAHEAGGAWNEEYKRLRAVARSPRNRSARLALGRAIRWDRAGRVYFGLTPACSRAISSALTRTRPMWDGDRAAARLVRWFLRRLE